MGKKKEVSKQILLLVNLIPTLLVQSILLYYWLQWDESKEMSWYVNLIHFQPTVDIGTPIILFFLNFFLFKKWTRNDFWFKTTLVSVLSLGSVAASYFYWGIGTGNLGHPDNETVGVIIFEFIQVFIIVLAGSFLCRLTIKQR